MTSLTCCQGTLIAEGRYQECECSRQASVDSLKGGAGWLFAALVFVVTVWTGAVAVLLA